MDSRWRQDQDGLASFTASRTHSDTEWTWAMAASSVWVSALSGSLSQSHSSLCLASLLSVSHLYPLLFFSFFSLVFFAFSVTPFGLWCWVFCFFFFFLIDYLGHGLLGWSDDGLAEWWLLDWGGSWLLDWPDDGLGGFMIFWEGARAKN